MFSNILFISSALLTLVGAIMVVINKNLMHACVYLLASLFGVAGLYAVLGAEFIAATQMVVYAGGVIILMLFAIMLTGGSAERVNRFGLNKIPSMGNKKTYIIGGIAALISAITIIKLLIPAFKMDTPAIADQSLITVEKIGTSLATDHILAFEISSVLLLGALMGAAIISRPRKEIHD